MANTYIDYGSPSVNGSNQTFTFTFEFLESTHVKVEVDGVETTAFTINASAKTVTLTTAPATGSVLRIRRDSDSSVRLMDFSDGSVLVENDLDKAYLHNLYLNEEIDELNNLSLQKAAGSNDWDAKGNKITNVGEPTLDADAATQKYVNTQVALFKNGIFTEPLKYTFDGDGSTTVFTFSSDVTLSADTLYDVNIDGVAQEPKAGTSNGSYSVNPDNDTITFTTAPTNGSRIVVVVRGYSQAVSEGSVNTDTIVNEAVDNTKITNLTITNAKISDSAGIGLSKLEDVTSGNIVVGSSTNKATGVAMSGDATISNTGVVTVANITNAKVATTAAIAHAKLATTSTAGALGSTTAGTVTTIPFGAVTQNSDNQISTTKQIKTYVDNQVQLKDNTDEITEGSTNLYYTEARVTANSTVAANTAKNSYPSADATKLAGIATGAEVNVQADWNAASGDALILNKPTEIGVADNAVTAAKISDSDGQFLVDDGTTKKVVVNNSGTDVDFTVKGDTNANLLVCDAGLDAVGVGVAAQTGVTLKVKDLAIVEHATGLAALGVWGATGAAISLDDQSTNGQTFNVGVNADSINQSNFSIGHIEQAASSAIALSSITISGTEATLNFSSNHTTLVNDSVVLTGANDSAWNTTAKVIEVVDSDTLKITAPNSSVPSTLPTGRRYKTFVGFRMNRTTNGSGIAETAYNDVRFDLLPRASTEPPSWLVSGQLWVDSDDNTVKIKAASLNLVKTFTNDVLLKNASGTRYLQIEGSAAQIRLKDNDQSTSSVGYQVNMSCNLGALKFGWEGATVPTFEIHPHGNLKIGLVSTDGSNSTTDIDNITGEEGMIIYCANGDSGSPCLAAHDGTSWKRVALGAVVAGS